MDLQMIQAFNNFKNNFRGDPEEEVRKLLASGKMSQNDLNKLQAMARELQKMLK